MDKMRVTSGVSINFNGGHELHLQEHVDGNYDLDITALNKVRLGFEVKGDPKDTKYYVFLNDLIKLYEEHLNVRFKTSEKDCF